MSIEKPELFSSTRSGLLATLFFVAVILLQLIFSYSQYSNFISKDYYFLNGVVQNSYQKSSAKGTYTVLKIESTDGLTFYTTTNKIDNYTGSYLRVKIYPNNGISFWGYLGTFYTKSTIKRITKSHTVSPIKKYIEEQHDSILMKSFYSAIFLATPIDKNLRNQISKLGVSHLIALSGFHIGILWSIIYFVLAFLYKPIQRNKFPHRYILFDVGLLTLVLLGLYLWYVDFPPSLVRSYTMALIGWGAILLGMNLVSFSFLLLVALLLLTLNTSYIVSISFWLSLVGVFYIFLLLKWCINRHKLLISMLCIPIGIFILMQPIVHVIFAQTSIYQLISPILSILFVLFYPLSMLLHILNMGDLLDSSLLWIMHLPQTQTSTLVPVWLTLSYLIISLLSIRYKTAFLATVITSSIFAIYLFAF